jgi:hypothetical protein
MRKQLGRVNNMNVDICDVKNTALKDKVIKVKIKHVEYCACKICGKEIEINYRVTGSWRGWVVKCPTCGVIKEYDN